MKLVLILILLAAIAAVPCAATVTVQNQTTATADDGSGSYLTVTESTLVLSGWTSACGGFNRTYSLQNQTSQCLSGCANNFFSGVTSCAGAGSFKTDCCNGSVGVLADCIGHAHFDC